MSKRNQGSRVIVATNAAELTEADRQVMRDHGYETIIVGDLTALQPIDGCGPLSHTELLQIAIEAMKEATIAKDGASSQWRAMTHFRYRVTHALIERTGLNAWP